MTDKPAQEPGEASTTERLSAARTVENLTARLAAAERERDRLALCAEAANKATADVSAAYQAERATTARLRGAIEAEMRQFPATYSPRFEEALALSGKRMTDAEIDALLRKTPQYLAKRVEVLEAVGLALRKEASDHECSAPDCPLCVAIDAWDALVSTSRTETGDAE